MSVFALNLSTALGLALAIDYTLLIVSRYRDEIAGGAQRDEALTTTMVTAGRTVLFSATTVAHSLAAMVLFPMYFLKSFAHAGIATVTLCAVAALVVTPAAIMCSAPPWTRSTCAAVSGGCVAVTNRRPRRRGSSSGTDGRSR